MRRWLVLLPFVAACGSPQASPARARVQPMIALAPGIELARAPMPELLPTPAGARAVAVTPAPTGPCPDDMVAITDPAPYNPKLAGFCIDRFEAPNVAGARPLAFQTAHDGHKWCRARGKRLCNENQWLRACKGTKRHRYPYGDAHVAGACNDDKQGIRVDWDLLNTYPSEASVSEAERLFQGDPSGSRESCVTDEGVFDMTGNVAEWVSAGISPSRYGHVIKGCYWGGCFGEKYASCDFTNAAHPGIFRSYEVGFRCCKDLDEDEGD